jgi:hypothetical protein
MPTTLANLIVRMNAITSVSVLDDIRKVNAIDDALRDLRAQMQPPWCMKKTSIRLFDDILRYAPASDHLRLAFIDVDEEDDFALQPRFRYTSTTDFQDNADPSRNLLDEAYVNGVLTLGVRFNDNGITSPTISTRLDDVSTLTGGVAAGDAGTAVLDTAVTTDGCSSSIRLPITLNTGTASWTRTFTNILVSDYSKTYYFRRVWLGALPASVTLAVGKDASNYFYGTVTAQFSGAGFAANDWNILGFEIPTASKAGTPDGNFAWEQLLLANAPTGNYYVGPSDVKEWLPFAYWYYSSNNVITAAGVGKDYFCPDGATYDATDILPGQEQWHQLIVAEAQYRLLADSKEETVKASMELMRTRAWKTFADNNPDETPTRTTETRRFINDFQSLFIERRNQP